MVYLKGLVALVTGGASGLGLATAARFVKHGASVVLCDLPTSKGQSSANSIGERCIFAPADVTSEAGVNSALSIIKSNFQKLDIVVNCAAVSYVSKTCDYGNQQPHSLDAFSNLLNVNTVGTLNVIMQAVKLMAKNNSDEYGQKGVIVNTTSISAFEGSLGHTAFAASCRSLVSMTEALAQDLSGLGIRCCAVAPGLFDTPYFQSLPEKYRRYLPSIVPFPKGLGNPDEFAQVVQSIVENRASNGSTKRVDGALRYDV